MIGLKRHSAAGEWADSCPKPRPRRSAAEVALKAALRRCQAAVDGRCCAESIAFGVAGRLATKEQHASSRTDPLRNIDAVAFRQQGVYYVDDDAASSAAIARSEEMSDFHLIRQLQIASERLAEKSEELAAVRRMLAEMDESVPLDDVDATCTGEAMLSKFASKPDAGNDTTAVDPESISTALAKGGA
eukprot:TRINITY_DN42028_c0_g1_i1.p1 TRINITY_DN42028_c0_g1~~TRINITY_DN42028_c0_g1_i1.p1  ORF type:complete len:188 (-),score=38.27 TRINITY_DN42028_c0_g1_i1:192-755(-)